MNQVTTFEQSLTSFRDRFAELVKQYDGTVHNSSELEKAIDDYSAFILDEGNKSAWETLEQQALGGLPELLAELRKTSSLSVAIMEKYRALKLLAGETDKTDYFKNIESCIEQEFGSFQVTAASTVLLIGSGSFPMTPLFIAKRTRAQVIGLDIDEEAIELGRRVVHRLGSGLNIRLEKAFVEQLADIKDVTHIIFSSTVSNKYELLEQLYGLTNEQVVVAMRYGNGLKSLFNYPMQAVKEGNWQLVDRILRPEQVFDIALYKRNRLSPSSSV